MCLVVEVFFVSCSLSGCEMRVAAHQKPVFGPILGGFGASNRFLAQSSAGLGLQISFWPNPRRVSGFKSIFDAIPGGFRASNRFLAQSPAGFGLQIGFWRNSRRVSGFKSVFGAIPGGFRGVRVGAASAEAGKFGRVHVGRMQFAPTPGTWSLLGVEASGLLSCLSVVRWLDKQFNISTSQQLKI